MQEAGRFPRGRAMRAERRRFMGRLYSNDTHIVKGKNWVGAGAQGGSRVGLRWEAHGGSPEVRRSKGEGRRKCEVRNPKAAMLLAGALRAAKTPASYCPSYFASLNLQLHGRGRRQPERGPFAPLINLVKRGHESYICVVTETQRRLLRSVVRDGLKIQPRFSAPPVYGVTGKGHLQSEGVGTLQRIKRSLKRRREKTVA